MAEFTKQLYSLASSLANFSSYVQKVQMKTTAGVLFIAFKVLREAMNK